MRATTITHISEDRKDLEWEVPKLFYKAKIIINEDACMKFYDKTKPLYLEADASWVGIRAGLLQTRDGMNCLQNKNPDSTILR